MVEWRAAAAWSPRVGEGVPDLKIYRLADGVYVRTRADLSAFAVLVDPGDAAEMCRAREYFLKCGLAS